MNNIIEDFYEKTNIPQIIKKDKIEKFKEHSDIAKEFELWIREHKYCEMGAVTVEGYTAKSLSDLSPYLDGDGAFLILIELRRDPEKALERIKNGFKWK